MAAPARLPAPPSGGSPHLEDHFVHLGGVSWQDYEHVLAMRGDRSAPRIAYLDGVLEIMSPSIHHESVKSNVGRLLEVWMDERGFDYRKLGSWTLKKEESRKGADPDECYVLGDDLEEPERPDLVIEVVWTHGGIDKLAIAPRWRSRRSGPGPAARSGCTCCGTAPTSSRRGASCSRGSI